MPGKRFPEDRRREQILEAAYRVSLKQRLAGLSSRAVAAKAGVSNGLVFFYFGNRRELLLALLDWLLAKTILRRAADRGADRGNAAAMLAAEIQEALEHLPAKRNQIELFLEYWIMGAHDEAIRKRIRQALKLYRDSYLPLAQAVIAEQPARYSGLTGKSIADIATSLIEGCALRLVAEPRSFNANASFKALAALLSRRS